MRLILQRVSRGAVTINHRETRSIGLGLVALVGVCSGDNEQIGRWMAEKMVNLRIFDDENGNLNRSLLEVAGECLIISNFTLYANCRKGRRPAFVEAAPPQTAVPVYEHFVGQVCGLGVSRVKTGEFGAHMAIDMQCDGPVTITLDSDEIMPKKQAGGSKP